MIPYSRQCIDERDINAVVDVLRSDIITRGKKVGEFEQALCKYTGAKYCIVVSSGTAALHLATLALTKNRIDSYIFTTPISFVATSNAILYSNNVPHFIDISPDDFNIGISELASDLALSITFSKKKVIGVIATDFAGQPCNWEDIKDAAGNDIFLIRDACHSIGSIGYNGEKAGSCKFADATIFSFHPVKSISTGEGGAILTNNPDIAEQCRLLRNHGIKKNTRQKEIWYYDMTDLGYNYHLTDIQCALGISQLSKLDLFVERRRNIAKTYNMLFEGFEYIKTPFESKDVFHAYHLYILRIDWNKFKITRNIFFEMILKEGIQCQVHYIPIFLHPYYESRYKHRIDNFDNTMKYYKECISIPCYPMMADDDIFYVANCIKKILNNNRK